ncbi:MAG: NAD(P)H-dependent oxidoreductase [Pseudomonadota bacterium]
MQVLAFAASNSKQSINKALVSHALEVLTDEVVPDAHSQILDLNDLEMPIYSIDRQHESGIPEPAHVFFDEIGAADALVISYAEHNGSYTAAFKNLFDWASRIDSRVFQSKPTLAMSASAGCRGGASVLSMARTSAKFFGAEICASFSVGPFAACFQNGALIDQELALRLRDGLAALATRVAQGAPDQ